MEDIWKLLAGLAIFLFALKFLEQALKNLAGRPFKKFLRKQTTTPLKGILGGAGITAILQSSTLISLMMIAFVGAGILSLSNAIGVIFGTNLGTTATGWIVAWLGFDLEIDVVALPMVAVGGLLFLFFEKSNKIAGTGQLILGFGFLFIGLSFMKETIEKFSEGFDITEFSGFHPYLFYPVGVLLAGLIHSGSAVVVMGLSALGAGLIPVEAAAALVVGGDLGKTSTAILGSLRGMPVQKQVAAAHTLFNVITNILALTLLYPLLWIITEGIGIRSPHFSLVAFHTLSVLIGILVLFPFVRWIAKILGSWFKSETTLTQHISKVSPTIPDAAIEALHKEIMNLADKVVALNIEGLRIDTDELPGDSQEKSPFKSGTYEDHYREVKKLQGETIKYFLLIQNEKLEQEESERLSMHAHALNHLLKSAKRLKNVVHNIRDFESSGNDAKHELFEFLRQHCTDLYAGFHKLLTSENSKAYGKSLSDLIRKNRQNFEEVLQEAHQKANEGDFTEVEIATFYNANHEIYSANKAFLEAMADMLLSPDEISEIENLPEMH